MRCVVLLVCCLAGGWRFRQLMIGGRRAVRARMPNKGYFRRKQGFEAIDLSAVGPRPGQLPNDGGESSAR
jgi:hypothetical protein